MDSTEIASLVIRARNGDAEAFSTLYQATCKRIFFLCNNMLRNRQDAEDVMQEVYLTAYKNLHQLDEPEKFRSWLSAIAVNQCRNLLKKNIPLPVEDEVLEQAETAELVLPEDYIYSREKRRVIMKLMKKELSELQYQTVLLYYFNQYSVSEVAVLMECSENAVKNRLSVARAKIRKGIGQYEAQNNDKLYSAVPFLTRLLSEEANTVTERMSRHMLNLKLLIGAGAVIIAAGGAGVVMHLQKNAPPPPPEIISTAPAITPTEELHLVTATSETAVPETQAPENSPEAPAPGAAPEDATLYNKGLEIIALMDEECRNENWLSLYASGSILDSEALAKILNGDYSAPETVYKATLPEERIDLLMALMDADTGELPAPLEEFLRTRMLKGWVNVLNARMGADYVAAGSIITAEKVFVSTEVVENCIYIYTYENACPVAVIYTVGEGGAVMASGQVILAEPFETGSAQAIADSLLGRYGDPSGDFMLFEVVEVN